MARELRTLVDILQDADENNRALVQELTDKNDDLQKTVDKMKAAAKKQKTWKKKTERLGRRQKHALKNKNKTIADMTEHDENQQALLTVLETENQKLRDGLDEMKYYINEHACMLCGGTVYCATCYPAPVPVPMTSE